MCTVLLPLDVNPVAVNKYININIYKNGPILHFGIYCTMWKSKRRASSDVTLFIVMDSSFPDDE